MKVEFNLCVITVVLALLTGCSPSTTPLPLTSALTLQPEIGTSSIPPPPVVVSIIRPEVTRYDRYLLVSIDPMAGQRTPLSQIIDIRISPSLKPTVADALHYLLRYSGYRLCTMGPAVAILYPQPLPAVQYQLGPMRLLTGLQLISGSPWNIEIDEVQRVVCHTLRNGYSLPSAALAVKPKGGFFNQ
jgi:conjugative transfer region protein (TIGR03748 family)